MTARTRDERSARHAQSAAGQAGGLAITALFVALSGCGARPRPDAARPPASPVPARRNACLAPPWVLPDGAREAGLLRQSCSGSNGRQATLRREGSRDATQEELLALLARVNQRLRVGRDVASTGLGLCCDDEGERELCVRVHVNLCGQSEANLAAVFSEEARTAPAEARVSLSVRLQGATGPRCGPPDPRCVPVPYSDEHADYDPDGDRTPISEVLPPRHARLSWGDCHHDGDCNPAGCGNQCVPWTESVIGTCEGYTDMDEAFCGCVNGQCTWFVQ